jgi:hypothetical protein
VAARSQEAAVSAQDSAQIMEHMWSPAVKNDPHAWVMYAFPWGVKGTPLEKYKGPRRWQKEELIRMRDHIRANMEKVAIGLPPTVYKSSTTSGRGIGKSSLVAWIVLWFESCILGGTAIISANTDSQLTSKTFGEIGKWKTLCLSGYWFEMNQKKLMPAPWFAELLKHQLKIDDKYYYAEGVLWNEDNPDAFAGAHNDNGMLLIFDEASGIPKPIWTVSEGFFTELSIYRFWFAFSNPRRNTGAFFECFHANRKYWRGTKIDSRTVEDTDKAVYDEIIATHGEDSDEARIEVKGDFPSQGDRQFISRGLVADAAVRKLERADDHAALLLGCDPARYGDDSTVIRFRRGRDARSIPAVKLKGADNMAVANKIAHLVEIHKPDAIFVDAGAGAGIIDRLREMGFKVHEVWFGGKSEEPNWSDHRTELWARMRDWLGGAMIDDDQNLIDDLCGPEYGFQGTEDKIKLEAKEKMKARGLASPDNADALAVTFHAKIARKDFATSRNGAGNRKNIARGRDYSVFG